MSGTDATESFDIPEGGSSRRRRASSHASAEDILRSKARQSPRQRSSKGRSSRSPSDLIDIEDSSVEFDVVPKKRRPSSGPHGSLRGIGRQNSFSSGNSRGSRRNSRERVSVDAGDNSESDNDESYGFSRSYQSSRRQSSGKSKKSARKRVSFSEPLIDPRPEVKHATRYDDLSPANDDLTREDDSLTKDELKKSQADLTADDNSDRIHPLRMLKRNGSYSQYKRRHGWRRFFPFCSCVQPQ